MMPTRATGTTQRHLNVSASLHTIPINGADVPCIISLEIWTTEMAAALFQHRKITQTRMAEGSPQMPMP